jgi:hypothetical protein
MDRVAAIGEPNQVALVNPLVTGWAATRIAGCEAHDFASIHPKREARIT